MHTYANSGRLPTLQELANDLCEDSEIEYVNIERRKISSIGKIEVGEAKSIFTKLNDYPYEFEINSFLQLASIDGVQIANVSNKDDSIASMSEQELQDLIRNEISSMTNKVETVSILI